MSQERFISDERLPQEKGITKEDIKPIKSLVKDKTSKKLSKGLKPKEVKPSWWIRSRRKALILDLVSCIKKYEVKRAWAHNHFVNSQEKKAKNITIYIEKKNKNLDVHRMDAEIDKAFKRRKISVIDIDSLQPSIREFVSKDISPIL
mgnify:CR=1 FL=1